VKRPWTSKYCGLILPPTPARPKKINLRLIGKTHLFAFSVWFLDRGESIIKVRCHILEVA
jgi:hypothetical protein